MSFLPFQRNFQKKMSFFFFHFFALSLSFLSPGTMETATTTTPPLPSASTSFISEEDDDEDETDGTRRDKALDLAFDLAASRVASFAASKKLADADALRLYGFYKQALEGDCGVTRPAIWDRKGRAKW